MIAPFIVTSLALTGCKHETVNALSLLFKIDEGTAFLSF
jgi:hypothetical protein